MAVGSFKRSLHVRHAPLDSVNFAVWNLYVPVVAVMDRDGLDWLGGVAELDLETPEYAALTATLLTHRLIYRGEADPYAAAFFESVSRQLARSEAAAQALHDSTGSYGNLYVTNSACNLGCSYCISAEADRLRPKPARAPGAKERKRRVALAVIDQYLARKRSLGRDGASISFNGGEILLEWPLLREMLEFARVNYPEIRLECGMNSNLTRMSPEIASGLAEFGVNIYTSIDGHREHHDRTRVDRRGRGSYDDVMRGIRVFNQHAAAPIEGFQGTIDRVGAFDADRLFAMHDHGFVEARLAPNLLHTTHADAEAKANLHADLFERGQNEKLLLTDTYFHAVQHVLQQAHAGFTFYCAGLSGLPNIVLTLNLDTTELSQLCSFVSPAALRFDDLGGDAHAARLWEASRSYIVQRLERLRGYCGGCEVLGVCRGGCIMNGLDLANEPNPPACSYQRVSWRRFLGYAHRAGGGVAGPRQPGRARVSERERTRRRAEGTA